MIEAHWSDIGRLGFRIHHLLAACLMVAAGAAVEAAPAPPPVRAEGGVAQQLLRQELPVFEQQLQMACAAAGENEVIEVTARSLVDSLGERVSILRSQAALLNSVIAEAVETISRQKAKTFGERLSRLQDRLSDLQGRLERFRHSGTSRASGRAAPFSPTSEAGVRWQRELASRIRAVRSEIRALESRMARDVSKPVEQALQSVLRRLKDVTELSQRYLALQSEAAHCLWVAQGKPGHAYDVAGLTTTTENPELLKEAGVSGLPASPADDLLRSAGAAIVLPTAALTGAVSESPVGDTAAGGASPAPETGNSAALTPAPSAEEAGPAAPADGPDVLEYRRR